ncbi:MAG: hypothetical protein VX741_09355, partial [Pseudomonadota bacterium]|nr:hypothetical protein [Pseudomonadota bacterium]
ERCGCTATNTSNLKSSRPEQFLERFRQFGFAIGLSDKVDGAVGPKLGQSSIRITRGIDNF